MTSSIVWIYFEICLLPLSEQKKINRVCWKMCCCKCLSIYVLNELTMEYTRTKQSKKGYFAVLQELRKRCFLRPISQKIFSDCSGAIWLTRNDNITWQKLERFGWEWPFFSPVLLFSLSLFQTNHDCYKKLLQKFDKLTSGPIHK